ncbi:tetratricopeptide repeat (TPR)-like superfamily protein [Tasmannia lanceolata]|uniref:tetratricopeptide repeat (TPR)-like superfamily protein n=1 Tax=Tasmannia lanceolata TaxID=3420 RepID=UPI004062F36D
MNSSKQCSATIIKPFSLCHQLLFNTFSAPKSYKKIENALKILDLVTPKTSIEECSSHIRLMKAFTHEFFQTNPIPKTLFKSRSLDSVESKKDLFDGILDCDAYWEWMTSIKGQNVLNKEIALSVFVGMHKEGMRQNARNLSSVLSSCGAERALSSGMQIHSFAIRTGFDSNVSVGSSLISLYSKCGELDNAYLVFDKMPVRNTVSWTAIIVGFAQHCQVEMCLELFYQMRLSALKPNDFTFASVLSVCMGSGSLGPGRSAHSQTIRMGFNSYIHVANALISMYAKCGSIQEANFVFERMPDKDLISWNSMIAGYAQHGLAEQAINLLKSMEKHKIKPDAITFLGILSSCRHAGLLEQGRLCFNSMFEQGVKPELDHYSCMVDLLSRTGRLEEALEFIEQMPICPNAVIWGSLLSSCRVYENVWIGIKAAKNRLLLEPGCAATHVQLANLYANAGCWDHAANVRKLMKEKGLKTIIGYSWIEIGNEVYRFRAEDGSNTKVHEIFTVVDSLASHMRNLSYVPKISLGLHEEEFIYD